MAKVLEAFGRKAVEIKENKVIYVPEEHWENMDEFISSYELLSTEKRNRLLLNKKYPFDKLTYYFKVWLYTEQNKLYIKQQGETKGKHLDHIVPIIYGWRNKIPAEFIGGINNLQMLGGKDNFKKNSLIGREALNLLTLWGF